METRFLTRASRRIPRPSSLQHIQTRLSTSSSSPKPVFEQAIPIGPYYAAILSSPSSYAYASVQHPPKPYIPPPPPPQFAKPKAFSTTPINTPVKPAILFSPRTVTKWEDKSKTPSPKNPNLDLQTKGGTLIAGIWVPPKPGEPDTCCMSGCVNCVWDSYGDELEEWDRARKEADVALAKESGGDGKEMVRDREVGLESDELLGGIDVGIREFMRVEKMLKEKKV